MAVNFTVGGTDLTLFFPRFQNMLLARGNSFIGHIDERINISNPYPNSVNYFVQYSLEHVNPAGDTSSQHNWLDLSSFCGAIVITDKTTTGFRLRCRGPGSGDYFSANIRILILYFP
jgi:hypothetical protein